MLRPLSNDRGSRTSCEADQRIERVRWRETPGPELLVTWFAHSHSASQFLQHLPSHWNSDIRPPHCGQTKLMIDEMICAFDSPGSVSAFVIIALLFRDPTKSRGADTGHKQRKCAARGFTRSVTCAPNWLAAESVSGKSTNPPLALRLRVQVQCQCG
jgi:hypothetical protein